tara:strand:- start:18971 stop:19177 length:207 start_codon:yes stop_codon:yes gene_type:complete
VAPGTSELEIPPPAKSSTVTTTHSPVKHQFTANMPPKKKVERGAQENIQLGPQVREVSGPHPPPLSAH